MTDHDRVEAKTLQAGNYLMFDCVPPFEGLRAKGLMQKPAVVDWDEAHPVSRFVTFGSLDVTSARRVELRKEDKVVVSASPAGADAAPRRHKRKPAEPPAPEEESTAAPLAFEAHEGDRHC